MLKEYHSILLKILSSSKWQGGWALGEWAMLISINMEDFTASCQRLPTLERESHFNLYSCFRDIHYNLDMCTGSYIQNAEAWYKCVKMAVFSYGPLRVRMFSVKIKLIKLRRFLRRIIIAD